MGRKKEKKRGKGSTGLNRKSSEEFLSKNRQKDGVIETSSGLQYSIVEESQGPKPDLESEITVNQRVLLIDRTVIADTYRAGEPETFKLAEAIEGLKEGIPMMSEGSRYKFFVPPDLAWGKRGAGSKIGPFATLLFDIRLEKIE